MTGDRQMLRDYYVQAAERLRQLDGLSYQLIQYYGAIFAAVFAVQNASFVGHQHIWLALCVVSALFFLIMLRLQRNYWSYTKVLHGIEAEFPDIAKHAPFTSVVSGLRKFESGSILSSMRLSYLYCSIFLIGFGFAAYCSVTGFGSAR